MNSELSDDGVMPRRQNPWTRRWVEAIAVVVFWGTLAGLEIAQGAFDPRGGGPGTLRPGEPFYIVMEYVLWMAVTPFIFGLARRFSFERGGWIQPFLLHVATAVGVSASADLVHHVFWNALMSGPPRPVTLDAVLSGFHFLPELLLYLIVLAAGFARDYFLRYRERVEEAARLRAEAAEQQAHAVGLKAQLAESRLQALRTQLNPHFLFNTLNFISSYLERDPRSVRRMIARLSGLLRYTLDKTDEREVPLSQELRFIDGYLDIQTIRFGERLTVDRDIDAEVLDGLVPTLILQPLVENAIKHGIAPRERGGLVELRAWREDDQLHLSVRDDGPGLSGSSRNGAAGESAGVGVRNTQARLQALYGADQHFTLTSAPEGGAVAHLVLPYHTRLDLYTTTLPA